MNVWKPIIIIPAMTTSDYGWECSDNLLVYIPKWKEYCVAVYEQYEGEPARWSRQDCEHRDITEYVTHWMHLPDKP